MSGCFFLKHGVYFNSIALVSRHEFAVSRCSFGMSRCGLDVSFYKLVFNDRSSMKLVLINIGLHSTGNECY